MKRKPLTYTDQHELDRRALALLPACKSLQEAYQMARARMTAAHGSISAHRDRRKPDATQYTRRR